MYNKVILIGRLTKAPELKKTQNDVSVTSFSIAVDRSYSKDGERKADFPYIVAWRGTAEFICKYFGKGDPILIEGELQSREYTDKDGNKRTVWEVVADEARFTGSKKAASVDVNRDDEFQDVEDDDLPF